MSRRNALFPFFFYTHNETLTKTGNPFVYLKKKNAVKKTIFSIKKIYSAKCNFYKYHFTQLKNNDEKCK